GAKIGGTAADAGNDQSTCRCIQSVDVEVLVRLGVAAACANVDVQRYRSFDELRVVNKQLAAAFSGEVPDEAEARRSIVVEVVELQVGQITIRVRLLIIPADAVA